MEVNSVSVKLGIVISTIGRPVSLRLLCEDIASQTQIPHCVVVVNQSNHSLDLVEEILGGITRLHVISSERGLSLGRNVGARCILNDVDYLTFPNDTSRYPKDFCQIFTENISGSEVAAASCTDIYGARYVLSDGLSALDRSNVWSILEPGMFIRSDCFARFGGFDELLGSGALSPWQSGEGTDLLLKLEQLGASCHFMPNLVVSGLFETQGLTNTERRRKLRAYGRGYGYVQSKWRYPLLRRLVSIVGALALGLRQSDKYRISDGLIAAVGRFEGLTGIVIGDKRGTYAVNR